MHHTYYKISQWLYIDESLLQNIPFNFFTISVLLDDNNFCSSFLLHTVNSDYFVSGTDFLGLFSVRKGSSIFISTAVRSCLWLHFFLLPAVVFTQNDWLWKSVICAAAPRSCEATEQRLLLMCYCTWLRGVSLFKCIKRSSRRKKQNKSLNRRQSVQS